MTIQKDQAEKGIQLSATLLEKMRDCDKAYDQLRKIIDEFDVTFEKLEKARKEARAVMTDSIRSLTIAIVLVLVLCGIVFILHASGWILWIGTAGVLINMFVSKPRETKALLNIQECESQLMTISFNLAEQAMIIASEAHNVAQAEHNLVEHNLSLN